MVFASACLIHRYGYRSIVLRGLPLYAFDGTALLIERLKDGGKGVVPRLTILASYKGLARRAFDIVRHRRTSQCIDMGRIGRKELALHIASHPELHAALCAVRQVHGKTSLDRLVAHGTMLIP